MRKEIIGNATLYLSDCRDILPLLEKIDAVVTDPPYGIGEARGKNKSRGFLATSRDYGCFDWDNNPIATDLVERIISSAPKCIVFGGNYYNLPAARCWLVWDKVNGKSDFADCELAWTNLDMAVRKLSYMWHGMLRANNEPRGDHPTQKPVGVMEWCLSFLPESKTVLDPFMGSGTTGVACMNMGKYFIGVEKEQEYFDIACKRIEQAQKQEKLFV